MKELAEFLIAERKRRNLPLEFISRRSGISMSMLRCFEEGDLECLGAHLLIRGTIRGYCGALEIDHAPLLEKFSTQFGHLDFQAKGLKKYARQIKLMRKKRRMVSLPLLIFALITALLAYGGSWISQRRAQLYAPPAADQISSQEDIPSDLREKLAKNSGERIEARRPLEAFPSTKRNVSPQSDADFKAADKAIQEAEKLLMDAGQPKEAHGAGGVSAEKEVPKDAAWNGNAPDLRLADGPLQQAALSNSMEVMAEEPPSTIPLGEKSYKFAVEADDSVWVQVKIDDKVTRSAMLHAGDKREWTAKAGMQVVIGNAAGVRMRWEDQPIKTTRETGRVLRFRLPEYVSD